MTFFQFKHFSFINNAIKRIVEHIKANAKKQCFFVNLKNPTFWVKTPRGEEILAFFKAMIDNQIIEFFGFFDIFIVGFGQNGSLFLSMTANPSSPKFEKTVWISVSKGYNNFKIHCPTKENTPSSDLRISIGHSQSPFENFERGELLTSPFCSGFQSVEREQVPVQGPVHYSPFGHGPWNFGVGPVSGFNPIFGGSANSSFFSPQPQFGRTPVCSLFDTQPQVGSGNPFTENVDFVPVSDGSSMTGQLNRDKGRLEIRKGRVFRVEIPSGCSSGQSTSSTIGVGGISKKSPRTPTTIANLEKRIAKLESQNPVEGSLDFSDLLILRAKLEKIQNLL